MAGVNYKEGMFLGKQELDRHDQIQDLYNTMLLTRMGNLQSTNLKFEGLIDPRISGLTIQAKSFGGTPGIWVGMSITNRPKTFASELLGRQIIGFDSQGRAMAALNDGCGVFAGENWIGYQNMYSGTNYILVEYADETHWEPIRISVDYGLINIYDGWSTVKSLFRNAAGPGRNVKLYLEGGDIVTVTSVLNNTSYGVLTVAETEISRSSVRFAVIQTMSPYSYEEPEYLYTYPCFKISLVHDIINEDIPAGKYLLGSFYNNGDTISNVQIYNSETKIFRTYGNWVKFDFIGLSLIKNSINSEYLSSMLWPFSYMQDAYLNYFNSSQDHPFVLSDLLLPTEFWGSFGLFMGESVWFVSRLEVGAGTMYLDTTPMLIDGYKPPLEFETYVNHLNGGKLVTSDGDINFTSSGRTLIKFKYFFGQNSHYFAMPFKIGV